MALEELKALAGEGLEKDAKQVDGSGEAYQVFLAAYCILLSGLSL